MREKQINEQMALKKPNLKISEKYKRRNKEE